ncbi:MAG: hypothetical protein PHH62_05690 [Endomicrobiaceae bacterium]|nr:hypothetical protein [Endomicrobiaceae bacterium]
MNKMKKIYIFISFILLSVFLNSFLYSPHLIDIVTNQNVTNCFLQWPKLRLFIEPFYAFSYYILTLERSGYILAISSWSFWILAFVITFSIYRKETIKRIIAYCLWSLFFLITIIYAVIILPVIGPKLVISSDYKVADIHSHTIASKDNISNVLSSINYHNKQGFTDFFITEHDNTNGFYSIPCDIDSSNIFPGIQIRTSEGVSVLLLSKYQFRYRDYQDKSIKEMIDLAHAEGILVVMPHWWKWHRPGLQELVNMGIDGFEIYNCGYRYISQQTRQEIIDICNKNKLLMFGTTDWHGLGYMTNVWTVIKKNGDNNLFKLLSLKSDTQIIVHDVKGNQSIIRYIFEPFSAFYYYIINTELKYVLNFYMLISIVLLLFVKVKFNKILRFSSLLFALFFSIVLFYFSYILSFNLMTNVIIPETILPVTISLTVIWIVIWSLSDKNI